MYSADFRAGAQYTLSKNSSWTDAHHRVAPCFPQQGFDLVIIIKLCIPSVKRREKGTQRFGKSPLGLTVSVEQKGQIATPSDVWLRPYVRWPVSPESTVTQP